MLDIIPFENLSYFRAGRAAEILQQELLDPWPLPDIIENLEALTSFVMASSGQVIAVASLDCSGQELGQINLQHLAVTKSEQGYGYGQTFVEELEMKALELSYTNYALFRVLPVASAVGFYENLGYAPDGSGSMLYKKIA